MEGLENEAVLSSTGQKLYHPVFFFMWLLSINSARKDYLEINECRIRVKTNFQQIVSRIYIDVLWQCIFLQTGLTLELSV